MRQPCDVGGLLERGSVLMTVETRTDDDEVAEKASEEVGDAASELEPAASNLGVSRAAARPKFGRKK